MAQGIDIGDSLSKGLDAVKRNPAFYVGGMLIVSIVTSLSAGILGGPLLVGFYRAAMRELRGEGAKIEDIFTKIGDDFVPSLIGFFLTILAINIGFMLCVIPGLILLPMLPLVLVQLANGEKDPIAAMKRAFEYIKADMVSGAVAMLCFNLVGALGVLICCVGAFVTAPMAQVAQILMAQRMLGAPPPPPAH
jgi:hypothetical protein